MAYEFIKVEKKGHILIVTLNRPERMNALHPPCHYELEEVFDQYTADPDQWVAIITGAGDKAFSAGNDLRYQAEHSGKQVREERKALRTGFGGLTSRFDCFKPLIAAVNGFALGGGFEIALACDIIIASEKASFGLPEPRVGLMAGAGGVHRLPRHVPYHIAMGMMMRAKRISAEEAHTLGLVNEVVPHNDLMAAAERWAAEIMEVSPMSLRATKEATLKGLTMSLDEAVATTFPLSVEMQQSEDFIEGPLAFSEKRKPNWKGK